MKIQLLLIFVLFSYNILNGQLSERSDTLIVGLVNAPPFIEQQENGTYEGINVWLWHSIAEEYNWNYVLKPVAFSEIISELEMGKIDVCINPLTITKNRLEQITFSLPSYVAHTTIVVPREKIWRQLNTFFKTLFSIQFISVISFLFLTLLIVGGAVWLLERKANPDQFESGLKGLISGIWWSAVTMTTVGYGDKAPKSAAGRALGVVWMFAAIMMISGFTGSIASVLTRADIGAEANRIQDFKDRPVATIKGSSSETYLKRHFFKDIEAYTNLDSCFQALKEKSVKAIIYDEPILQRRLHLDKSKRYSVLPMKFAPQFYAFAFAKENTKLTDQVSEAIFEITESADWSLLLNEYGLLDE
ncbi:MAG: transporter substrate-binding domain-containing protein [Bacteroidota bacterium]